MRDIQLHEPDVSISLDAAGKVCVEIVGPLIRLFPDHFELTPSVQTRHSLPQARAMAPIHGQDKEGARVALALRQDCAEAARRLGGADKCGHFEMGGQACVAHAGAL